MPSSFARLTACPRPFIVARNPTMWSRRAARSLTKPSSSTSTAVPFAGTSSVCLLHPSCRRAHQDTRSRAPFSRRASSRAVPRLRHPSIRPLWDGVPVAQSAAARLVLTSHPRVACAMHHPRAPMCGMPPAPRRTRLLLGTGPGARILHICCALQGALLRLTLCTAAPASHAARRTPSDPVEPRGPSFPVARSIPRFVPLTCECTRQPCVCLPALAPVPCRRHTYRNTETRALSALFAARRSRTCCMTLRDVRKLAVMKRQGVISW